MIFYFSVTGNSLYVAQKIYENQGEELINISNAMNEMRFSYKLKSDEKVGFIFPVYFYGISKIISEFVENLEIKSNIKPFIYLVLTCGSTIGNADKMFEKLLANRNYNINSTFSITMPNNYILWYGVPSKEKQLAIFKDTKVQIEEIIKRIKILMWNLNIRQ